VQGGRACAFEGVGTRCVGLLGERALAAPRLAPRSLRRRPPPPPGLPLSAGRDGLPSQCVLMYAPRDYTRALQMLRMSEPGGAILGLRASQRGFRAPPPA
jgi:hypothetical protein